MIGRDFRNFREQGKSSTELLDRVLVVSFMQVTWYLELIGRVKALNDAPALFIGKFCMFPCEETVRSHLSNLDESVFNIVSTREI